MPTVPRVSAHDFFDPLRRDLVEALHHAEHDFAVGELCRRRGRGIAKRNDVRALGEISENVVHDGRAERADVGDLGSLGEHGVGHDRAIAAQFVHAGIKFDVGALARRCDDALAEFGDRRDRREVFALACAQSDRSHDGVDETVESEDGMFGRERAAAFAELLQGAGFEFHGD